MELDFPTRTLREGLVDLLVPDVERRPGPGTRTALPFYNPGMRVARDLSVLLASRTVGIGGRILDGLAATGALGLRI
ncbi:MAG: N2,N2-dimethylguanosine tRNA methyltransferase, partial [Methanobacteriota archaeon]